ncbi:MAG TPA: 30S ribosomal protein S4e, partial [Candidatus Bathyarchaeota archaeon]|nr:30S ribosomal protein S4e [Candidatus Bathyarchaeota archaeon]HEW89755.1 30S ribosomal protein S4e [Candidatus Bathyarchaeota archaeon]
TWTVRPAPGPHPIERCIPLLMVIRDVLGLAKTAREARVIIKRGYVKVDGVVRKEPKFPVGLMDVVTIEKLNQSFRVLPTPKGLRLHPINGDEAGFKICRIEDKTTVRGGHIQLNLHDGRNVLVRVADPTSPVEDVYRTLDTLKIGLPGQELLDHFRLEEGAYAIITGGKNMGVHGRIIGIREMKGLKRRRFEVEIETREGEHARSILEYVFVVGREEPAISLPEVE